MNVQYLLVRLTTAGEMEQSFMRSYFFMRGVAMAVSSLICAIVVSACGSSETTSAIPNTGGTLHTASQGAPGAAPAATPTPVPATGGGGGVPGGGGGGGGGAAGGGGGLPGGGPPLTPGVPGALPVLPAQGTWTTSAFTLANGTVDTGTMKLKRAVEDVFVEGTLNLTSPAGVASSFPLTGLISPTSLTISLMVAGDPASPYSFDAPGTIVGNTITTTGKFVSLVNNEVIFGGGTFVLP